jgi:hypothetical protein
MVLADKAALFVDGRYTLQAAEQADKSVFAIEHLVERTPEDWLADHLPAGGALGYDPWRTSLDGAERLEKACARAKGKLVAVADNPLDTVWTDRPAPPLAPVVLHDLKYAGESAEAKLAHPRRAGEAEVDAAVLSDLASVAGPSTSAAATWRTRRWRSPGPSCRAPERRSCSWIRASSQTRCAMRSPSSLNCMSAISRTSSPSSRLVKPSGSIRPPPRAASRT